MAVAEPHVPHPPLDISPTCRCFQRFIMYHPRSMTFHLHSMTFHPHPMSSHLCFITPDRRSSMFHLQFVTLPEFRKVPYAFHDASSAFHGVSSVFHYISFAIPLRSIRLLERLIPWCHQTRGASCKWSGGFIQDDVTTELRTLAAGRIG